MTPSENGKSRAPRYVSVDVYDAEDAALVRAELSEPDTADYALITDYLARELSEEDCERFKERLLTDSRFRELAEPVLAFWFLTEPFVVEPDDDPAATQRTVEEFRRRLEFAKLPIDSPALEKKRAKVRRRLRMLFGAIGAIILSGIYECYRS